MTMEKMMKSNITKNADYMHKHNCLAGIMKEMDSEELEVYRFMIGGIQSK